MNPEIMTLLDNIWPLATMQIVQLTALICLTLCITKTLARNRSHPAHALWGLVLLKCLTPPLVAFPSSPFCWIDYSPSRLTAFSGPQELTNKPQSNFQSTTNLIEPNRTPEASPYKGPQPLPLPSRTQLDVQQSTNPAKKAQSPTDAMIEERPRRLMPYLSWSSLLIVWFSSSMICISVALVRLLSFLKRISGLRMDANASTLQIFEDIRREIYGANRMPVRCRVHLQVVNCFIGPAVVGLFRPRILLPRFLEQDCSHEELRMLLAHEMIHIRRGDLWWSAIQAVAKSLWWFHPLIGFVCRNFDRATELSCDEETVASLQCSPSVYARSLLSVLERKHEFKVAPLLPGVRPVEITSKRMERIMKLTEQASPKRPWWVLAVLLAGAMVVLPGARLGLADDEQQQSPKKLDERKKSSQPVNQASASPVSPGPHAPTVSPAFVNSAPILSGVNSELNGFAVPASTSRVQYHSSSPTIGCIMKELGCDSEQASSILSSRLESISPPDCKVIVDSGRLTAQGPDSFHKLINREMDRIQKYGISRELTIDFRMATVDKDVFEAMGFDWQLVKTEAENFPVATSVPVVMSVFDTMAFEKAISELQADARTNFLHMPKIRVFNGQSASIAEFTERPFIVGPSQVRVEKDGLECKVLALVLQENAVQLEVSFEKNAVRGVREFSFKSSGESTTLQVPDTRKERIEATMMIPKNGHLGFAMPSAEFDDKVAIYFVTPRVAKKSLADWSKSPTVQPASLQQLPSANPATSENQSRDLSSVEPTNSQMPQFYNSTKPVSVDSLLLMKADGPPMSEGTISHVSKLFDPFGMSVRFTGQWDVMTSEERTILRGKNISASSIDSTFEVSCASGYLLIEPASRSLTFGADEDAEVNLSLGPVNRVQCQSVQMHENGINAEGAPVRFRYQIAEDIDLFEGQAEAISISLDGSTGRVSGAVKVTLGLTKMEAESMVVSESKPNVIELSGNVRVTRQADAESDENALEMRGHSAIFNLETMGVQAEPR